MAHRILPQPKAPASVEPGYPKRRKNVKPAPAAVSRTSVAQSEAEPMPCAAVTEQPDDGQLWGHLGVRLSGDQLTRWYPVNQEQAGGIIRQLTSGAPWVAAVTLNNRALLVQPAAVQRLVILDDDADEPEGDWALSWSDGAGLGDAGYRALWECYCAGSVEGASCGSEFKAEVRGVIESHGLDEKSLHALLRVTHVRHRDGTSSALRLDARASWELFYAVQERQELPPVLLLSCWGEGMDYFAPRDQVALLDMPLHLMRDAQADAAADAAVDELDEFGAEEWHRMQAA